MSTEMERRSFDTMKLAWLRDLADDPRLFGHSDLAFGVEVSAMLMDAYLALSGPTAADTELGEVWCALTGRDPLEPRLYGQVLAAARSRIQQIRAVQEVQP